MRKLMSNDELRITFCNLSILRLGNKMKILLNDIMTNKHIKLCHESVPEESLWDCISQLLGAYEKQIGTYPGTVTFVGKRNETDTDIEYDWAAMQPMVSMTLPPSFICYVNFENNKCVFRDVLTSKRVCLGNLDDAPELMSNVTKFLSSGSAVDYMQNGSKRLIIMGQASALDKDFINIDARNVVTFADTVYHYNVTKNNLLNAVAGMSQENQ